ncbi:MAG: response regulator [Candidatus Omnitrophica bacterium]|nr:response regulator [Candidatus Omnitrophota bacterium]
MLKKKVLIVDDEKDFTKMTKINLEATGEYEVFIENISNKALEKAKEVKPDIILLDILMPDTDGFTILKRLKKDESTISIPVVMLTAVSTEAAKTQATSLYDEGYIEKPITIEDLIAKIESVLRIRWGRGVK